ISSYKPDRDNGLQANLQLGTNPHYLTVGAVGHTLTKQTSLASAPCNKYPEWFYNQDEPLIDDTSYHLLTRNSDDNTSHNFTSERTQLFAPPFNEDDTSNVFLLQFKNSKLKLSTRDGCSNRNTGYLGQGGDCDDDKREKYFGGHQVNLQGTGLRFAPGLEFTYAGFNPITYYHKFNPQFSRLQGTGGCGYVKKTFGDSGQQVPITVLPLTVYNVDLPPTSTLPVTAFFGTKTTPLPITALPSTLRPEVCEDVEFRLDVDASQLNLTTCMDFDFTQLSFFRNPVRGVAVPTMEYSYLPVVADSLSQSYHEDEEGVGWHSGGAVGVYVSTVNRPGFEPIGKRVYNTSSDNPGCIFLEDAIPAPFDSEMDPVALHDHPLYICQDPRFCRDFVKYKLCNVNDLRQGCFPIPFDQDCPEGSNKGLVFFTKPAVHSPAFCTWKTFGGSGVSQITCPDQFVRINAFEVLATDRKFYSARVEGDPQGPISNKWVNYENPYYGALFEGPGFLRVSLVDTPSEQYSYLTGCFIPSENLGNFSNSTLRESSTNISLCVKQEACTYFKQALQMCADDTLESCFHVPQRSQCTNCCPVNHNVLYNFYTDWIVETDPFDTCSMFETITDSFNVRQNITRCEDSKLTQVYQVWQVDTSAGFQNGENRFSFLKSDEVKHPTVGRLWQETGVGLWVTTTEVVNYGFRPLYRVLYGNGLVDLTSSMGCLWIDDGHNDPDTVFGYSGTQKASTGLFVCTNPKACPTFEEFEMCLIPGQPGGVNPISWCVPALKGQCPLSGTP
ncbi:uncharacterized protein LOC142358236, partial [Convolutriloba macropyga]|uniref:uncharacterized protein LOC142358236 n=1 Tax=Convolutriloba macropyga TaxID=536237 RepID=UPI003F51C9EC